MRLNNVNNKKWFVLYTKPRHELKVKENLSRFPKIKNQQIQNHYFLTTSPKKKFLRVHHVMLV